MDTTTKLFGAVKWSVLGEVSSKAATPLIFIILARILNPEDFGVTAIAAIIISFSQIFWDAGLNKTLIQRQTDIKETANIVFWTNITLSILIYLILFAFAGQIASAFNDIRAEAVIKVQGLQVIIASLCSVQTALFEKSLKFKPIFWTKFFSSLMPGFISIPLALAGYNYWALVAGSLAGALGQLIILWSISIWRPVFEYNFKLAKKIFSFSGWITLRALTAWLIIWLDSIIVGYFLTSHELGLYRTGRNFVAIIFGISVTPLFPIIYSYLSQWQNDISKFKNILMDANKIIFVIALPVCIFLLIGSKELTSLIFGPEWAGISLVIITFGLIDTISYFVYTNIHAYMAIGKPNLATKIGLFTLLWSIPFYIYSINISFNCFLWTRLIILIFPILLHLVILKKEFNIKIISYFNNIKWALFSGIVTFICIKFIDRFFKNSIFELILHLILLILIYLLILFLDKRIRHYAKIVYIKFIEATEKLSLKPGG